MPRRARNAPGGFVYHVLNRTVARHALFQKDGDYEAFERVIAEALEKHPIRVLAYCLMPNHWHLVLWPRRDGELTALCRTQCAPSASGDEVGGLALVELILT